MALSSCEDDLTAYTVDKDRYEVNEHPCAFLRNVQGDGKNLIDLYNAEGEQVELNIQLTKPVTADTKNGLCHISHCTSSLREWKSGNC